MANIKSLFEKEKEYLEERFTKIKIEDDYFDGIYEDGGGEGNDLDSILEKFLCISSSSFVISEHHAKGKGNKRYSESSASTMFQHSRGNIPIEFFGNPFIVESLEIRHCLHGSAKDGRGGWKEKKEDEHDYGRSYQKVQGTRKLGCPAMIQIRSVRVFEGYSVDKTSCPTPTSLRTAKHNTLSRLNADLEKGAVPSTMRYFVHIPLCTEHKGHPVGVAASGNQLIDKNIITKIYDLVGKGVTRPDEVKRCLDEFVERELFPNASVRPKKTNRRYYPTRKYLRNHILKAVSASRYSQDDQESLKQKVEEWKGTNTNANFFFRAKSEVGGSGEPEAGEQDDVAEGNAANTKENNFLFVHQEEWQQRLLKRYGSELVLMDATYKTTKYSLPLFFICVHTNVGYRVIAEFICECEDADSTAEALKIIKAWNDGWDPLYFMVDFSTAEINAIEREFPNALVYICDFHRLQAWKRWLPKSGLNPPEQAALFALLKRVADAHQQCQFDKALRDLRQSPVYSSHANVKSYVEKVWLSCVQRWAQIHRKQQVLNIVNTNNGVEAQNKLFKYTYLPRSIDKSVFGITVLLVESFLPDSYQYYCDMNLRQSSLYRRFKNLPAYLNNRPSHFVKHCLKSRFSSGEFCAQDVQYINIVEGEFRVKASKDAGRLYTVKLNTPSCTCEAWHKTFFPCKHMYAVFNFFKEWSFTQLPEDYKNSVFITLDSQAYGIVPTNDKPTDNNEKGGNGEDGDLNDATRYEEEPNAWPFCTSTQASERTTSPHGIILGNASTKQRSQLLQKIELVRNATYQVDDDSCLQEEITKMTEIHKSLLEKGSTDKGLPLRISPVKKLRKVTSVNYHQVLYKPLPARRRGKKNRKGKATSKSSSVSQGSTISEPVEENQAVDMVIETANLESDQDTAGNGSQPQPAHHCSFQCWGTSADAGASNLQKTDPVTRVRLALHQLNMAPTETVLDYGDFKVTLQDLFTLLPPEDVSQAEVARIQQHAPRFVPGWLTDSIMDVAFSKMGMSTPDVLVAETSLCEIVRAGYSTRRTWAGVNFSNIKLILIPIQAHNHWTLLAVDKASRRRLYLDPKGGDAECFVTSTSDCSLMKQIDKFSHLVDLKTGWGTVNWPCVHPMHAKQLDGYNCGVFICLFARCLVQGRDLSPTQVCLRQERQCLLSLVFGSCYDDLDGGRNVAVCKVCRQDDNEDWLGCDCCEQFFHASCLGVDFANALALPFCCP